MALPINVEDLIHQRKVERTRIEYKADWNPEPIIHSITAFANDFDNMGGLGSPPVCT
jgi:ATP-dependent DNA helicase RecG